MMAFCLKCRTKREMKNGKRTTMKNGRSRMMGQCSTCGTNMSVML